MHLKTVFLAYLSSSVRYIHSLHLKTAFFFLFFFKAKIQISINLKTHLFEKDAFLSLYLQLFQDNIFERQTKVKLSFPLLVMNMTGQHSSLLSL